MTCTELIEYLSQYIDQELDTELEKAAQEHLASCHNCSIALDNTKKTITLGRLALAKPLTGVKREKLYSQLQQVFAQQTETGS